MASSLQYKLPEKPINGADHEGSHLTTEVLETGLDKTWGHFLFPRDQKSWALALNLLLISNI